ncbi:CapA family protein [Actinocorallia sp. B10E7]|uniref:CapA family protein n=1 Tax=Actinocorallia sp. B10E7 TaxID=3153558 RepID=UPI00325CFD80
MASTAGCGPLAAPLDQGTEPPIRILLGGEAFQGRPPASLDEADLTVVSGDPATLGAAGVDVLVADTPADGFTTVSGTVPYSKEIGGHEVAVFGATSPERDKKALLRAVRTTADTTDFVMVYLLWPRTGTACPDDARRSLTAALVEAGADAVVGAGGPVQPGGFLAEGLGFVHYGLGFLNGGSGGLLDLKVGGTTVLKATWNPSTARGPLTGQAKEHARRQWRDGLTSCPGLDEGPAALRTS